MRSSSFELDLMHQDIINYVFCAEHAKDQEPCIRNYVFLCAQYEKHEEKCIIIYFIFCRTCKTWRTMQHDSMQNHARHKRTSRNGCWTELDVDGGTLISVSSTGAHDWFTPAHHCSSVLNGVKSFCWCLTIIIYIIRLHRKAGSNNSKGRVNSIEDKVTWRSNRKHTNWRTP
jgi:hypothetical protein